MTRDTKEKLTCGEKMGILGQEGIKIQTINSQSQALSKQNLILFSKAQSSERCSSTYVMARLLFISLEPYMFNKYCLCWNQSLDQGREGNIWTTEMMVMMRPAVRQRCMNESDIMRLPSQDNPGSQRPPSSWDPGWGPQGDGFVVY